MLGNRNSDSRLLFMHIVFLTTRVVFLTPSPSQSNDTLREFANLKEYSADWIESSDLLINSTKLLTETLPLLKVRRVHTSPGPVCSTSPPRYSHSLRSWPSPSWESASSILPLWLLHGVMRLNPNTLSLSSLLPPLPSPFLSHNLFVES